MYKIVLGVLGGIAITTMLGLFFSLNDPMDPDYVVKIDYTTVYLPEFYVYLYEQKLVFEDRGGNDIWETDFNGERAEEVAKQNALDSLTFVKVSANRALEMGLELTEEDLDDVERMAQSFYRRMGNELLERTGMTLEVIHEIMSENLLLYKIYNKITQNYRLSEHDFQQYFKQYKKDHGTDDNSDDLLEEQLRESYLQQRKQEIFDAEYKKWLDETHITINDRMWYEIAITDFALNEYNRAGGD